MDSEPGPGAGAILAMTGSTHPFQKHIDSPPPAAETPQEPVEARLIAIWREALDCREAGPSSDFFDLGGTSLHATRLLVQVEADLGVTLAMGALFEASTPRAMAELLRGEQSRGAPPANAKPPILCVGMGGWARPLASLMSPNQPFQGVGLERADLAGLTAPYRLSDLACRVATRVGGNEPAPPLLCGWCLDAVFAFEIARQLRAIEVETPLVALFDPPDPARLVDLARPAGLRVLAGRFQRHMERTGKLPLLQAPGYLGGRLVALGRRLRRAFEQVAYERKVRQGDCSVDGSNEALYEAAAAYRPEPFAGRVALFLPTELSDKDAQARTDAWTPLAEGGLEVFRAPGTHGGMFDPPYVEALAEGLRRAVARHTGTETRTIPGI